MSSLGSGRTKRSPRNETVETEALAIFRITYQRDDGTLRAHINRKSKGRLHSSFLNVEIRRRPS